MTDMAERLNAALEGRYSIDREVGEGGMATVYLADATASTSSSNWSNARRRPISSFTFA